MKRLLAAIIVIIALSFALAATAEARCPLRADKLEDFAKCMVPMKGTIGTTSVYTSGKYDRDNRALMSAMMRSNIVPRHVVPATAMRTFPYYSNFYSYPGAYMNLFFAAHSTYRNNWFRFASFYYPYNRYNPNMWIYAYYRR